MVCGLGCDSSRSESPESESSESESSTRRSGLEHRPHRRREQPQFGNQLGPNHTHA
jgi:hypothetical protein